MIFSRYYSKSDLYFIQNLPNFTQNFPEIILNFFHKFLKLSQHFSKNLYQKFLRIIFEISCLVNKTIKYFCRLIVNLRSPHFSSTTKFVRRGGGGGGGSSLGPHFANTCPPKVMDTNFSNTPNPFSRARLFD